MGQIQLQMIDHFVSSQWWRELMGHFMQVGDKLEIRCWEEETEEIRQASMYGTPVDARNEVSIQGIVTADLIAELLSEEPTDKSIYNKMTKYFTINVKSEHYDLCSAHYGTELYVERVSDEDISFFQSVMRPYEDCFSIHIEH